LDFEISNTILFYAENKAIYSYEILANFYQTTRCLITVDSSSQILDMRFIACQSKNSYMQPLSCLCMFLFLSVFSSKYRESNLFPLSFSSLFIFYNSEDLLHSSEVSDVDLLDGDKNYLLCIYWPINNRF
jgi:hypothetical protein